MKLRTILPAAALALGLGSTAQAADYVSIVQETTVNAPADVTWKKIGGYCDIGAWLKTTCAVTSGTGDVGTIRKIAGRIDEVIVAKTAWSYTYADHSLPIFYHGTVEVRPVSKKTSKIFYSLFYDQEPIKAEARTADRERRGKMFAGVLLTMKGIAEAK